IDTWFLPKARPISCNDCPAFQRLHMSVLCIAESLTRLCCVINTTFSEKIYIRWCCIDRLSWQAFSECGQVPKFDVLLQKSSRRTVVLVWQSVLKPGYRKIWILRSIEIARRRCKDSYCG